MAVNVCGSVISNPVTVTIAPPLDFGTVGGEQQICNGALAAELTNDVSASGGTGLWSYQWEVSTDRVTWTTVTGATSASFAPGALSVTTSYRRLATNACGLDRSNVVTIRVASGGIVEPAFQSVPIRGVVERINSVDDGEAYFFIPSATFQWERWDSLGRRWVAILNETMPDLLPSFIDTRTANTHVVRRRSIFEACGGAAYYSNQAQIEVR